ncbi:MAG: adenosylmethionine--8-amino-7-oxononanoate transaminase [Bacteroidota bacterium]|nr:adenosylmethionine--8-amino-7-oxononanoate transaminase [Bacteroidota bacterium]
MNPSSLSERDQQVIWHPYTQHQQSEPPIPIVRGEAALLYDDAGNAYIDAISSWWVNIHGHAHPYIADKIYQQALALEHVIFTGFTHEPAVQLAERLLKILPGDFKKMFYSDNGSTAVEVALKMAIQYWRNKEQPKRNKILAFRHAYHGDTFGSMSVSGRGLFTDAFQDFLFDVLFIDTPDGENKDQLNAFIRSRADEIACFIYEPLLQAAGGMRIYEAAGLDALLKTAKENQILCIADEVLTGFGRTGTFFASASLTQTADIICLSKGITGGTMALGATACTGDIFDAFLSDDRKKTFFHGHSYTANPIACAAGLASLDLLQKRTCIEQIQVITKRNANFLKETLIKIDPDLIMNPRTIGTVLAFELKSNRHEYVNLVGSYIRQEAIKQGIYLRPLGNTVYIMPPYCISPVQLEKIHQFLLSLPRLIRKNEQG